MNSAGGWLDALTAYGIYVIPFSSEFVPAVEVNTDVDMREAEEDDMHEEMRILIKVIRFCFNPECLSLIFRPFSLI